MSSVSFPLEIYSGSTATPARGKCYSSPVRSCVRCWPMMSQWQYLWDSIFLPRYMSWHAWLPPSAVQVTRSIQTMFIFSGSFPVCLPNTVFFIIGHFSRYIRDSMRFYKGMPFSVEIQRNLHTLVHALHGCSWQGWPGWSSKLDFHLVCLPVFPGTLAEQLGCQRHKQLSVLCHRAGFEG